MTIAASTSPDSPKARKYNRIRRRLSLADTALAVGVLIVLLATGWTRQLRDASLDAARHHYALAVVLYVFMLVALAKLAGLGLDYYGFRLEHRFQLSNQTLRAWVRDELKGFAVGVVLATVVVELLYMIIRAFPEFWWLVAWAAFIALAVVFAQLAPVLLFPIFYKFIPLDNAELEERLVRLCQRAGARVRGVYEWKLSEKSRKANAALAGLGATRRIILADTLLENYSADEIEAVLAHELGHHVHRHILKSILLQMGISLLGFYAASAVLRYAIEQRHMFEETSDFAALPLLALVSTLLSILLLPALNAFSRHNERVADRYCWQSIASVKPFVSSMNKLSEQNLSERQPSRFVEWAFHSHPAISKRIAAAQEFARQQRHPITDNVIG